MRIRVALAAASLLLAGKALAQTVATPPLTPAAAPVAAQGGLITPGRSPELEILFTGDVVGFLEPCG